MGRLSVDARPPSGSSAVLLLAEGTVRAPGWMPAGQKSVPIRYQFVTLRRISKPAPAPPSHRRGVVVGEGPMSELDDRSQGLSDGGGPSEVATPVLGPGHPLDDDVLRRPRAKVRRPEEAVPAWDGSGVRPTLYRPDWMLLPAELVRTEPEFLAGVLRQIGLAIPQQGRREIPDAFPVPVQLRAAPPVGTALGRPIDGWHALQAIRAAAAAETGERRPRLVDLAHRASLDHLACSIGPELLGQRSVVGTPGSDPHGVSHGWGTDRLPVRLPMADAMVEAMADAVEKARAEGRTEAETRAMAEALGAPARPTAANGRRP